MDRGESMQHGTLPSTEFSTDDGRQILADDQFTMHSVGVDIGSATTHLVFSKLTLLKVGSRYVVKDRDLIYESPVVLTPFRSAVTIDGEQLGDFLNSQFEAAGLRPDEIEAGALILTGVALLRDNARRIADAFALESGRFVAVSAGDVLEAVMAAFGSGAVERSRRETGCVLNIDIGGGTTKLALCAGGDVVSTAALDVGARLVVVDDSSVVCRIEPSGARAAEKLGVDLAIGRRLANEERRRMGAFLAGKVVDGIPFGIGTGQSELLRSAPLEELGELRGVIVSGGIAEYVYGRESRDFGDLGQFLSAQLLEYLESTPFPIMDSSSGIHATALGAAQYTVQVSGNTIYCSPPDAIPLRNVPVVLPSLPIDGETVDAVGVANEISRATELSGFAHGEGPLAIRVEWSGTATYERLRGVAEGIAQGLRGHGRDIVILVCDQDIGRLLGVHLDDTGILAVVVSIDCIDVDRFDYIDIGYLMAASGAVSVTVKSLLFP